MYLTCDRGGCHNLVPRAGQKFCSAACRAAGWREAQSPTTYRSCELCGDQFPVRYRNQRICDYNTQAHDDCALLQEELEEAREELEFERRRAVCEREGCVTPVYRPGRGRPKRFCSPRCKTAFYRAARKAGSR